MIDAGIYKAKATGECVLGASKQKGTPFIEVYFTVTDGDAKGQSVRWTSYFTDTVGSDKKSVAQRTIETMQRMGWQGDDMSEFNDGQLHGLGDNEVSIVVEHEEYENEQGETKVAAKVAWVNSAGGFLNVQQRMNDGAAAQFAARMRGLVHKVKAANPVPAARPANGAPPKAAPASASDVSEDEIPF